MSKVANVNGEVYPVRQIRGLKKVFGFEDEAVDGFIIDRVLYLDSAVTKARKLFHVHDNADIYAAFKRVILYANSTVGDNWDTLDKFLASQIPKLLVN